MIVAQENAERAESGEGKARPFRIHAGVHARWSVRELLRRGMKHNGTHAFKRWRARRAGRASGDEGEAHAFKRWRARRAGKASGDEGATGTPAPLQYGAWAAVERIANLFCIYPSSGQGVQVSSPVGAPP